MLSFDEKNFKELKLTKKIFLKREISLKISNSTQCENPLSSQSSCEVNYESEILSLNFLALKFPWILQKVKIIYNDKLIKQQEFSKGIKSKLLNNIEMEMSIANMNILFYDKSDKKFLFVLVLKSLEDDEVYEARFSMELAKFILHHEWSFRNNHIGFYHPDKDITSFFDNDFEVTESSSSTSKSISLNFSGFRCLKSLTHRFESFGYCEMFQRMLSLEDLTVQKALNDLILTDKLVQPTNHRNRFQVYFEGKKLSEKLGFNHLVLTPMTVCEGKTDLNVPEIELYRIYTQIVTIDGCRVVFEKSRNKFIDLSTKYHVQLVENRMPNRLAMKSLESIKRMNLEEFFTRFKSSFVKCEKKDFGDGVKEVECCNSSISTNPSQLKAVKQIISRSSFPSPYVVFGPPGTGKTSTLVEAIAQIVKLQPSAKVLVTANSNAACDEIGERLLKFIPRFKMYRLYSPSFDISFPDRHMRLHPLLKHISNMKSDLNCYPSYEEFYSYNVIISTLINCGRIITADVSPSHFDYIFIDECASTIEPFSIIPIALLGAEKGKITAQVILAGDHKQLQGMVHSYFNEKHGFGISLMERVMMLEKYQHPYDSHYVTQLTDNFRSHWAILKFSNNRFYHSVLNARQKKEIANFAIGWDLLPNKNFPLIFHSILAPSEMDGTSLFNPEEVHVVGSYVKKLLVDGIEGKKVKPEDIGIICPYGAQRKRLQERFKNTQGLEVGTVDAFQGREKLIIIMSTVRSQTDTVGFLKNEKRLNVALTRAKALLIVIGNGETLQKNKLWYKFLNYCYHNKALIGERFMLRYRKQGVGVESIVKKPHAIFQVPKVPFNVSSSQSEDSEEVKVSADEDNESDWTSFDDESDSDVSWTCEDFRMKARTAKIKKRTIASLVPRIAISVPQSVRSRPSESNATSTLIERVTSLFDDLARQLAQLKLEDSQTDLNNNSDEVEQISKSQNFFTK